MSDDCDSKLISLLRARDLFVCVERPSQQFFSHVGTEPTLPGFNQYCRELMSFAQGHNTVTPVGIEPRASRFRVRRSTTTSPREPGTALSVESSLPA